MGWQRAVGYDTLYLKTLMNLSRDTHYYMIMLLWGMFWNGGFNWVSVVLRSPFKVIWPLDHWLAASLSISLSFNVIYIRIKNRKKVSKMIFQDRPIPDDLQNYSMICSFLDSRLCIHSSGYNAHRGIYQGEAWECVWLCVFSWHAFNVSIGTSRPWGFELFVSSQ